METQGGMARGMLLAFVVVGCDGRHDDNEEKAHDSAPLFNVTEYGAVADDGLDDSAAVQNAIDSARNAGGGVVYVPNGLYPVADLKLYSKIELRGETWAAVLRQNSSAAGVHYVFSVNPGSEALGNSQSDITIRRLTLMDNIESSSFLEHQHVLNLNGVKNVLIDGVQIAGFRGDGIYLGSGNDGLPDGTLGYAIDFFGAGQGSEISIVGNTFQSQGRMTYAIKNSNYVFADPSNNVFADNIFVNVSGNDFEYAE